MIISWWSGGIASAVTCKLCLEEYGTENTRVIFIDTFNEHPDTYRFLKDCEKWYKKNIEIIHSDKWSDIRDIWRRYKSLNSATGAICSTELKRRVREDWQKKNAFTAQAFGFDIDELKRAKGMTLNYPNINPIFPLIEKRVSKEYATRILLKAKIEAPIMYRLGFRNNNCFNTGCVQGGIGYWQKIKKEFPEKFEEMAKMEHELTDLKGKPVTILKDQGRNKGLVFLKKHPKYPEMKEISQMKGLPVKPLLECNGFCGVNDFLDVLEYPDGTPFGEVEE